MRIGIDVRYLSHGLMGGIHTYLTNLLPELIKTTADDRLFLYADTKRPFELTALPAHVTLRLLPWNSPLSSIYNDCFLWRTMAKDRLDVAHFPGNYGFAPPTTKSVVTLHDEINLLPLREIWRGHPHNLRTIGMMTYLHWMTRRGVSRADKILTVSEYARQRIAQVGKIDPKRITAIAHGCPADVLRIQDQATLDDVRTRLGIDKAFVMADALKNPVVLVRAWQMLPERLQQNNTLVFFSRRPDVQPEVLEFADRAKARLLVRPSRADLIALFSMAHVFVFPSWIEGFGLPLIEAMKCGAAIIASDRGAIPEVVGKAARLIDAEDAAGLAENLRELLEDSARREELQACGLRRAENFTWQKTASQVYDTYAEVIATGISQPVHNAAIQNAAK